MWLIVIGLLLMGAAVIAVRTVLRVVFGILAAIFLLGGLLPDPPELAPGDREAIGPNPTRDELLCEEKLTEFDKILVRIKEAEQKMEAFQRRPVGTMIRYTDKSVGLHQLEQKRQKLSDEIIAIPECLDPLPEPQIGLDDSETPCVLVDIEEATVGWPKGEITARVQWGDVTNVPWPGNPTTRTLMWHRYQTSGPKTVVVHITDVFRRTVSGSTTVNITGENLRDPYCGPEGASKGPGASWFPGR